MVPLVLTPLVEFLIEPLTYPFMMRALLTALIAGVVCAVLSCWLVLVGWSLMGDAVSHAVLPGVVLAYIAGVPFALGALVFGFGAVALIGAIRDTSRIKEDAAIGIVFTTLFALGLVLISVTPSQVDLHHIVFGNLLGVSRGDLLQIVLLGALVLLVLLIKRRDLTLYAFDATYAFAIGLNPRVLGALLLGLQRHHRGDPGGGEDRKSTRLNSSHVATSYAVFCLQKQRTLAFADTTIREHNTR